MKRSKKCEMRLSNGHSLHFPWNCIAFDLQKPKRVNPMKVWDNGRPCFLGFRWLRLCATTIPHGR
jgi:hypothetical protein